MSIDELRKALDKIPDGEHNKARRAEIIRQIIEEQKKGEKKDDRQKNLPVFT